MSGNQNYNYGDDNGEESDNDFNPGQEVGSDNEDAANNTSSAARQPKSAEAPEDDDDEEPAQRRRSASRRSTPGQNTLNDDDDIEEEPPAPARSRQPSGAPADDDVPAEDEGDGGLDNDARDEEPQGDDDNEDDEDEDENEEDEEEEEVRGHRRKRHKRDRRNQFIDVEAEVDEEDEEVDEEDEELPEGFVADTHPDDEGLPAADEVDDRRHRELDRRRQAEENLNAEEQAALFKERYGRNRAAPTNAVILPQRLLLPSVEDPTIWGVRCKPGKEREIVFAITKRIEDRMFGPEPMNITSAFERGGGGTMAGFVYVEARKQADVMTAMDQIPNAYPRTKMVLVPINEMPDLLRTRKSKTLEPGMYVRCKRGKFQGDLGQVESVEANGLEVELRLIPREDYGLNEDINAPTAMLGGPGEKRKRPNNFGKSILTTRPPQRLFSEVDARKKNSKSLQQLSSYNKKHFVYLGNTFINGFMIKAFKVQHLQTEDVNPTLEEVTKFTAGAEDGTENLDLTALAATLKASNSSDNYLPGDMVEIYLGEQRGISGKAITVHGDIVTLAVTEGGSRGQKIDAPVKTLRKRFNEGDHVKVIGGSKYIDEVGMVLRIKDDKVTLLSDANNQEVTVFSKDLRNATDSGITPSGSKYDIYDLVQLDPATVACVVKVDRESLKVLDQSGSVRTILPSSISNKLERRKFAVATDKDGTEIRNDDTVKETSGEQRQGTVLHIHRQYVFLRSRQQTENAGVFVTRNSSVITVAAKGGRIAAAGPDLTKMNPVMQRNGGAGSAASAMPPPKSFGRDRLIGKTVTVRKGPYKGLLGIVKDTTDTDARIELHTKNKVITVGKDVLTVKDPITGQAMDASKFGNSRGGFGGAGRFGGATPGRQDSAWDGGRTPAMNGGKTPAWNSAGAGGRTPGWKQSSRGRTPAPSWNDGSRTVNPYADGSQTAYGGATAYGGSTWNANAATPYHSAYGAGSRTPAYGEAHGRTPAHTGYDAPTPGFSAATPGAGLSDHPTPRNANPYGGAYATPAAPTPGAYAADTPAPYGSAQTPGVIGDDEGYE